MTAAKRDEQRKMIKYNHLVANLLIFHTIVGMTRALDAMTAAGERDAITDEALADLSPYQTEHINRFGDYVLDLSQPPAPLPFAPPMQSPLAHRATAPSSAVLV
ncbi:MAG: Tn3 family transposase [Gammaproteobacteria bacterium]|nr:Tn3 family transposase [Gammaproteobacteria bacterium]